MDFNTFVNSLSWKKIIVIGLGVMIGLWVIREIIFWTFFHEAQQVFTQLNSQISQQQKDIQKKLSDSDKEFSERGKKFDEVSDHFGKTVEEAQKNIMNYMNKVQQEQEALQKSFNKSFKEAADKMWAEHEKFGEKMRKDFTKQSQDMHADFKNNVMNVDKTLKSSRCQIVLGKALASLPPPNDLTLQQLKERNETIKRIEMEIAKKEHCEAYL